MIHSINMKYLGKNKMLLAETDTRGQEWEGRGCLQRVTRVQRSEGHVLDLHCWGAYRTVYICQNSAPIKQIGTFSSHNTKTRYEE